MKAAYSLPPEPCGDAGTQGPVLEQDQGHGGSEDLSNHRPITSFRSERRGSFRKPTAYVARGEVVVIITYGMGVYWSKSAAKNFPGRVTIIDLRTLVPLDEEAVMSAVRTHKGVALVVTEEQLTNSFAQALASRIGDACFEQLDAPVRTMNPWTCPLFHLNSTLEAHQR